MSLLRKGETTVLLALDTTRPGPAQVNHRAPLEGFKLKISKVNQRRQTILVKGIRCANNSKCYPRFHQT